MSNQLNIEIIESRVAGSNVPFEFSVVASDSYGSTSDSGYASLESLIEAHPTRLGLLEWLSQKDEFAGAFKCEGSKVIMDSVSSIDFSGYPEDDSITSIEAAQEIETPKG